MPKYWYKRVEWALHNIIAHPICEILCIFRLFTIADWLHDALMPHDEDDYMAVCQQYELDKEDLNDLKKKVDAIFEDDQGGDSE